MITKLTLRNFKSIGEQSYEFGKFDLLVGRNNSGKSTVLQALVIWQFCVDEFHRSKRGGSKGIQVILPNFTALPVPEFNLLWKDKTDRRYPYSGKEKSKPEYILIEIQLTWLTPHNQEQTFSVQLRYQSRQTIYAIPVEGWKVFRSLEESNLLPRIAYVPSFSGLEPAEEWRDDGILRRQVGKAQPGGVLRNLMLRVFQPENGDVSDWNEIQKFAKHWFSVELLSPKYQKGVDTQIICEYAQGEKNYDIIAGGSGFHQTLTLLAFLYGYRPTTILLDEPDAHLHVNLQREILDYFKKKSAERGTQFLIATHAEEFAKGVDASQIVSLLAHVPKRIQSKPDILRAMADVSNVEITGMMSSPFILYVEGESDERILRAWADTCGVEDVFAKLHFKIMGGGGKDNMKTEADRHFAALRHIVPEAKRLMLFDFDEAENAFHPKKNDLGLFEWKRKNIENYLFVPDAWKRAVSQQLGLTLDDLFVQQPLQNIGRFFADQNLTLPPGKNWRNVTANVFEVVDGKRILFENDDSLFHTLRQGDPSVELIREKVAATMLAEEIHEDVYHFFEKLRTMAN